MNLRRIILRLLVRAEPMRLRQHDLVLEIAVSHDATVPESEVAGTLEGLRRMGYVTFDLDALDDPEDKGARRWRVTQTGREALG